ncbi:MAG TPA: hypothetical protein PLT07_02960, partial [Trueperaceae bacterium]|nr:hypothetical protein [Trueperaceae bacterium]
MVQSRPARNPRQIVNLLLLLALLTGFAFAQEPADVATPNETPGATAQESPTPMTSADAVPAEADAAVKAWLARPAASLDYLIGLDPAQLCRELPAIVVNPGPVPGTEVRVEDRIEHPSADPDVRRFTYAAVRPGNQLDVVEVVMQRSGGTWTPSYVGFLNQNQPTGVRAWLQTPAAGWVFVAFSLLVLLALLRPGSPIRRWLVAGMAAIKEHRRLVAVTLIGLYALFALGAYVGTTLPAECEQAVLDVLNAAIGSVGA